MITYPLSIPGPIYPDSADLKQFDAIAENISPFDGTAEQQQFQDQHWELDLEWPEMTWAQFAAVQAFSAALHGKLGSFLWGPPLATGPRGMGSLAGKPLATGADASGSNLLHTSSWMPNQSGVLLPGDFLALPVAGVGEIFGITQISAILGVVSVWGPGTLPTAAGNGVWIAGTGISDGGLFVVTSAIQDAPGQWMITFNNPLANGTGLTTTTTQAITVTGLQFCTVASVGGMSGSPTGSVLTIDVGANQEVVTVVTIGDPDFKANFTKTHALGVLVRWNQNVSSAGTLSTVAPVSRLFQYVNPLPLATDGGGNATLDIFPAIRETPAAGTPLILTSPQGAFRLAENRRSAPAKKNKTFTFSMKCREAI
jgi:hypothetical protein